MQKKMILGSHKQVQKTNRCEPHATRMGVGRRNDATEEKRSVLEIITHLKKKSFKQGFGSGLILTGS